MSGAPTPAAVAGDQPPPKMLDTGAHDTARAAWLGGVEVVPVRTRAGVTAWAVTVAGAPDARVQVHLAGREPLVLRADLERPAWDGIGRYQGVIEPARITGHADVALPQRFVVQMQAGAHVASAVVEAPPPGRHPARRAALPAPTIHRVALTGQPSPLKGSGMSAWERPGALTPPDGAGLARLSIRGTPGALALAWVPDANGQLHIVPLAERRPGHYDAALRAGSAPMAVELAVGREVATWPLEHPVRLAGAGGPSAPSRTR